MINEDFPFACAPGYFRTTTWMRRRTGPSARQAAHRDPVLKGPSHTLEAITALGAQQGLSLALQARLATQPALIQHQTAPTVRWVISVLNLVTASQYRAVLAVCVGHSVNRGTMPDRHDRPASGPRCQPCGADVYCPLGSTEAQCAWELSQPHQPHVSSHRLATCAVGVTAPELQPWELCGRPRAETCKLCDAGSYEPAYASVGPSCTPCARGEFCLEGAASGTTCPPGTIRETLGAASADDCNDAPLGHFAQLGLKVACSWQLRRHGWTAVADCKLCQ